MNNLFKKEKAIELDANYSIETDKGNGVSLVFQEQREKENKTTKLKEPFIFVDRWYFNTVGQSLTKYVELSQNSNKDLKKVIEKTNAILSIVKEFRDKYKNW